MAKQTQYKGYTIAYSKQNGWEIHTPQGRWVDDAKTEWGAKRKVDKRIKQKKD